MKTQNNMTKHINTALRDWLSEPLTDAHWTAIQIASHSKMLDESPVLREARAIRDRNRAVPNNFTDSLDACRLIELKLPRELHLRFATLLMKRAGGGWESLALASEYDHAAALCDVLDLGVTI